MWLDLKKNSQQACVSLLSGVTAEKQEKQIDWWQSWQVKRRSLGSQSLNFKKFCEVSNLIICKINQDRTSWHRLTVISEEHWSRWDNGELDNSRAPQINKTSRRKLWRKAAVWRWKPIFRFDTGISDSLLNYTWKKPFDCGSKRRSFQSRIKKESIITAFHTLVLRCNWDSIFQMSF